LDEAGEVDDAVEAGINVFVEGSKEFDLDIDGEAGIIVCFGGSIEFVLEDELYFDLLLLLLSSITLAITGFVTMEPIELDGFCTLDDDDMDVHDIVE